VALALLIALAFGAYYLQDEKGREEKGAKPQAAANSPGCIKPALPHWPDYERTVGLIDSSGENKRELLGDVADAKLLSLLKACDEQVEYVRAAIGPHKLSALSSRRARQLQQCGIALDALPATGASLDAARPDRNAILADAAVGFTRARWYAAAALLTRQFAESGNVYQSWQLAESIGQWSDHLSRRKVLESLDLSTLQPQPQTQQAQLAVVKQHCYQVLPAIQGEQARLAVRRTDLAILWADGSRWDIDLDDLHLEGKALPDPRRPGSAKRDGDSIIFYYTDSAGQYNTHIEVVEKLPNEPPAPPASTAQSKGVV
jgi:hypothetical protein